MSDLLQGVVLSAEPWAGRLGQASWHSALVLAAAWAIARWCTFLSPRVICWILRLACLKLVVALFWVEPIGLPLLPAAPAIAVAHDEMATPAAAETRAPDKASLIERVRLPESIDPQPRTATTGIGPTPVLPLLWLVGFCACVTTTIGGWISIRRLCRAAAPAGGLVLKQAFRSEAERLGIRRLPALRLSPRSDGPLLAGIARPTIILPNRAEETFDESELRLVLAHELAHLKRRDLVWNWLPTIVGWLFWFHPLVWLITRRWSEAQEAACDELLIQNRVARPSEYGRLLLKLAAGWPEQPRIALIAVGMFGPFHNLERRILTMTRVRAFSIRRLVMAAVILSLVAVPGVIPWRLVAQEPGRTAQPKNSTFDEAAKRGLDTFEQGDYAQALADFDDAIRIDPKHSEARRWRGDALLNRNEVDKAMSAYEAALRLDPKNAMAYASRGMAWTSKGELNKALDDFRRAIELRPALAGTAHYQRSVALAKSLRGNTNNPKFTEAANRGDDAFRRRDFAQAATDFEEAVRIDPNHSEARRWLGDAFLNRHEFDKALSAYEEAIRLDPTNALAYVSRGMAWTEKREPGPALVAFDIAVRLDPTQAQRPLYKRYVAAAARSLVTSSPAVWFGHPAKEKSPFAAVRWQKSQPEVRVGDEWFKLLSLNGIPVSEIVDFSRQNFGKRWQMRFEEDLVELLTRMGHPPGDTATLVVQSPNSSEPRTLKDVPMTAANRWAIKAAGDARRTLDR